jgi:hypothetical protein
MSENGLSLKVLEAYTRDVGRGVARIDYDSMDTLNASTGDVIELKDVLLQNVCLCILQMKVRELSELMV